ncbi:MAG: hypothetical protein ACBZ72_08355 [Candidatus Bathyarchaeia archaeon]
MNTHNFMEETVIPALGRLPVPVQKLYLFYFSLELVILGTIFGY